MTAGKCAARCAANWFQHACAPSGGAGRRQSLASAASMGDQVACTSNSNASGPVANKSGGPGGERRGCGARRSAPATSTTTPWRTAHLASAVVEGAGLRALARLSSACNLQAGCPASPTPCCFPESRPRRSTAADWPASNIRRASSVVDQPAYATRPAQSIFARRRPRVTAGRAPGGSPTPTGSLVMMNQRRGEESEAHREKDRGRATSAAWDLHGAMAGAESVLRARCSGLRCRLV